MNDLKMNDYTLALRLPKREPKDESERKDDPYLLGRADIWIHEILAFVGPGHYIFVAPVSRQMKKYYENYFATIKSVPRVDLRPSPYTPIYEPTPDVYTVPSRNYVVAGQVNHTYCTAAFSSISREKYSKEMMSDFGLNNTEVSYFAARAGNVDMLQRVRADRKRRRNRKTLTGSGTMDGWICTNAAFGGHLNALKWLQKVGCTWDQNTSAGAASGGQLSVLKWLYENRCPVDHLLYFAAAYRGHLDVLKWARENTSYTLSSVDAAFVALCAAAGGHLGVLKWMYAMGLPITDEVYLEAAYNGHLEVLKWARSIRCPWHRNTSSAAATNGHLEVLKWAHENGCPWDRHTSPCAAEAGQMECLKYAHAKGCPWDEVTCSSAARSGHLEILKWARAKGCPWDVGTSISAAGYGNLELLQWACQNGCPLSHFTSLFAAFGGHLDILQFIHANGCPWHYCKSEYRRAARKHPKIAKFLREHGQIGVRARCKRMGTRVFNWVRRR